MNSPVTIKQAPSATSSALLKGFAEALALVQASAMQQIETHRQSIPKPVLSAYEPFLEAQTSAWIDWLETQGKREDFDIDEFKSFAPGLFMECTKAQKDSFRAEGKPTLHRSVYEWLVNKLPPAKLPEENTAYDEFFNTWYKAQQWYADIAYCNNTGQIDVATPNNSIPSKGSSSGVNTESDGVKLESGSESESEMENESRLSLSTTTGR